MYDVLLQVSIISTYNINVLLECASHVITTYFKIEQVLSSFSYEGASLAFFRTKTFKYSVFYNLSKLLKK